VISGTVPGNFPGFFPGIFLGIFPGTFPGIVQPRKHKKTAHSRDFLENIKTWFLLRCGKFAIGWLPIGFDFLEKTPGRLRQHALNLKGNHIRDFI